MRTGRWAASASLVSLSLAMLAACGGGGGPVSTPGPAPAPAPTPTPGQTPTPTPGQTPTPTPGQTPAPTPTPPPGPSPAPSSLVNPTVAYTYPTEATNIVGTLNDLGQAEAGTVTGPQTATIRYNPATSTYIYTRPDGARTFDPADWVAGAGNLRIPYREFQIAVAGGYENLIISSFPDTAHARLNWVGNGLFVRQLETGGGFSVSADAFYFGLPTVTGRIPTSGSAEYEVYMLGALASTSQNPDIVVGGSAGLLSVDFSAGTVNVSGIASHYNLITGSPGGGGFAYSGTATLSAGEFSGDFELANIDGTWDGGFFGPAGQEVGAAFRGGTGSTHYIGTLVGSSDLEFRGIETDFLDLDNPVGFPGFILEDFQEVDPNTGQTILEGGGVRPSMAVRAVGYDPSIDQWDFQSTFRLQRDDLDPTQSDSAFDVYGDITVDADGTDGGRLLRPGAGNSLIELTYTSYGSWETGYGDDGSGFSQTFTRYHSVFGFPTKSSEMPTLGSATYSGVLFGVAGTSNNIGGAGTNDTYYTLTGNIDLSVNFGTESWSGTINPIGDDRNSDAIRDFGVFTFYDGTISEALLQNAEIDFGTTLSVGTIFGHFFGPQAAEVGGGFDIYFPDPLESGNNLSIDGLFVGKKD